MKITIEQLHSIQVSLGKLLDQDLPIRMAYRMGKLAKTVREELNEFEEARVKLVEKIGEKVEEDGKEKISVPKDKMEVFSQELKSLLDEEVDVDFEPIKISDVEDIKLSAIDMANLDKFLTE